MIFDRISELKRYRFFSPGVQQLLEAFFSGLSPATELGRHEIMGGKIYANVERYDTRPKAEARIEIHRAYLDIQLLLSGREDIYCGDAGLLTELEPYDAERDIGFFAFHPDGFSRIALSPGYLAVILPGEGHMPQVACGDRPEQVTKAVIKISGALL